MSTLVVFDMRDSPSLAISLLALQVVTLFLYRIASTNADAQHAAPSLFGDLTSYLRDGSCKWLPCTPPSPVLALELISTILTHPTQPVEQLAPLKVIVTQCSG